MKIRNEEMRNIHGGAIASAMINAITKGVNAIYELGKQTGSAIRRLLSGGYCNVK